MKNPLLTLVLVAAAALALWVWRKPPTRRLAPEGVFYLLDYVSVQTPRGVIGFEPGQEVRYVSATSTNLRVTDGKHQVEVSPAQLTTDLDIAALVRQRDDDAQRQIAAYQAAEEAAYLRSQREFNVQHSLRADAGSRAALGGGGVGGRYTKLDEPSVRTRGWAGSYPTYYYNGGAYNYLQSPTPRPGANGYNVNDWNR